MPYERVNFAVRSNHIGFHTLCEVIGRPRAIAILSMENHGYWVTLTFRRGNTVIDQVVRVFLDGRGLTVGRASAMALGLEDGSDSDSDSSVPPLE